MIKQKGASQIDLAFFHKLWTALPAERCDRNFWSLLESLWEPLLQVYPGPFQHKSFFSLRNVGHELHTSVESISLDVLKDCSVNQALFDAFSLWNPLTLSAMLRLPITTVIEQLLLAVEKKWMVMRFVVCCVSCAYDIKHCDTVGEINLAGRKHAAKTFRCPMCTDYTTVHSLNNINVFFRLDPVPPLFMREHYRFFHTKVAEERKLESIFCPAGARFAIDLQLPEGCYLLSAPFIAGLLELEVMVGFEDLAPRKKRVVQIVDLKKYTLLVPGELTSVSQADPHRKVSIRSTLGKRNTLTCLSFSQSRKASGLYADSLAGRRDLLGAIRFHNTHSSFYRNGDGLNLGDNFGNDTEGTEVGADTMVLTELQRLTLEHGKVRLIFYNDTASSGFVDLFVAFERWAEFNVDVYPNQLSVSEFMHYVPRGLRSNFIRFCVPKPPSNIEIQGIFVRHFFDLNYNHFTDPHIVSVIQEVHRYSLEDHHGLLINVCNGGTIYDSFFLSITAAIASSMCFFQRVLLRLGEAVALSMRCSINNAPLYVTTYQVQYNDAENMRSAYPDVQFVGPAIYNSSHPSIVPPTLYAFEQELPRNVVKPTKNVNTVLNFDPFELSESEKHDLLIRNAAREKKTMIRFEIRSFSEASHDPRSNNEHARLREGAQAFPVKRTNILNPDHPDSPTVSFQALNSEVETEEKVSMAKMIGKYVRLTERDTVLPHFLDYLCEHLEGTTIEKEPHAIVILVPLPALQASVKLPTLLESSCYEVKP